MQIPTMRRCVDIAVATTALAFGALPLAILATVAKIESRNTGIFRQTRLGLHGKEFTIFKLRTLHPDGRPLPISGLWRKSGVDEIPQLWNIAKGDMSFIGPRPVTRLFSAKGWDYRLGIEPGLVEPGTVAAKLGLMSLQDPAIVALTNHYVKRRLEGEWCVGMDMMTIAKALKLSLTRKVDGPNFLERNASASASEPRPS